MAGAGWTWFQRAVIIFFDILLIFSHEQIRILLRSIANNRRTLTAIRSQFAELKKDPALYDSRKRTWTAKARKFSYSERTPLDIEQHWPSN